MVFVIKKTICTFLSIASVCYYSYTKVLDFLVLSKQITCQL